MRTICFLFLASCAGWHFSDEQPRQRYYYPVQYTDRSAQILQNAQYHPTNCTTQAVPFSYPTMYRTTCN
jgi:hypothetical protein